MIFDLFAYIVERYLPFARKHLDSAKLFIFPEDPHKTLSKTITKEELDFLSESFVLPFDCVAVEDPASCIILYDAEKNQAGLCDRRMFIECLPVNADISHFREGQNTHLVQVAKNFPNMGDACIFSFGYIENVKFSFCWNLIRKGKDLV